MSAIWIDIEDSTGIKQGDGPIITASDWKHLSRLDSAGTFSFSLPASDPRSNLCQHKSIAHAWTIEDGIVKDLGAGIIDLVSVNPVVNGPTRIEVSGFDLLRELNYVGVGDLELFDRNEYLPDLITYQDTGGPSYDVVPPFTLNLQAEPTSFLYFKNHETFDNIRFVITTGNNAVCPLRVQYYNSVGGGSWDYLTAVDGTSVGGAPLKQSGVLTFEMPADWQYFPETTYYIVRIFNNDVDIDSVDIADIKIELKEPTPDGLGKIFAFAPAGWSLDVTAGNPATDNTVYQKLANETVLAALVFLAEATGEHFALSMSGRRLRWLGTRKDSSSLRATASVPGER